MTTHRIILVGGPMADAKFDVETHPENPTDDLPATFIFADWVYRRTNVFVPPRHDDKNVRRRVYLHRDGEIVTDEDLLDLMGGEAGGA